MNNIKAIRTGLDMTQVEFSRAIKRSQATVCAYEHGGQTVPVSVAKQIIKIAKAKGRLIRFEDIYT